MVYIILIMNILLLLCLNVVIVDFILFVIVKVVILGYVVFVDYFLEIYMGVLVSWWFIVVFFIIMFFIICIIGIISFVSRCGFIFGFLFVSSYCVGVDVIVVILMII